jgi:hypothetical protein
VRLTMATRLSVLTPRQKLNELVVQPIQLLAQRLEPSAAVPRLCPAPRASRCLAYWAQTDFRPGADWLHKYK